MLNNQFKLYVIHNNHVDVGYTDRQEKIELYHVDFIKQVTDILRRKYSGDPSATTFKWTCESFWAVEKFMELADEKDLEIFYRGVKEGDVCLSGNYLNLTELVDYEILKKKIKACVDFGAKHGAVVDSAMTADINGCSWGFSQALFDGGIRNFFSCIHTHHGMFPLNRKQTPFWWETPEREKIFVWNGEYYHIGNELGIAEGYETTYKIFDQFHGKPEKKDREERARIRIYNYVAQLRKEKYKYDFAPVMVSGMITDNAPPSIDICNFINKWNAKYGQDIELEFVGLDEFFRKIKHQMKDIPVYRGDWTDWWADGVGSTPAAVKSYKDAQRKYHLCKMIDPGCKLGKQSLLTETEDNLMIYSEHTWGYSSSISEPCNTLVNELDIRKTSYVSKANEAVSRNLDLILYKKGDALLYPNGSFCFKILNPYDYRVKDVARINIFYCEGLGNNFEVVSVKSGKVYPHQVEVISRGREVLFYVELGPKEELTVQIREIEPVFEQSSVKNHAYIGSERVRDLIVEDNLNNIENKFFIDNEFYSIKYDFKRGIYSWFDKTVNKELIDPDEEYFPFTPVYQKTTIKTDLYEERRIMGRNRKGQHAKTFKGKVTAVNVISSGPVLAKVELVYGLEGTSYSSVLLTAYKNIPRVEVTYRVIKDNTIQPENMYLPLTFNLRDSDELWIEKSGVNIRPGIDQLPGTCLEYYLLQNGLAYVGEDSSFTIATKDVPLIFMGGLDYHMIKLADGSVEDNKRPVFSWIMNNFWETNFKATLGGAYEFTYIIESSKSTDVKKLMKDAYRAETGLLVYQIKH